MTHTPEGDQPFDRLRAADPGAHAEPDVAALRASVTSSMGDVDASVGADEIVLGDGFHDELSERRRRRRNWQVAAVVAGALVVGGGGFGLGHFASDSGVSGAQTALGHANAGDLTGFLASLTASGGTSTTDSYGMEFDARSFFSHSGLSTTGTKASVWGYDARAVFSEKTALDLAKALGVDGEAKRSDDGWVVGKPDTGVPSVVLGANGTASFSFSDPTKETTVCPVAVDGKGVECTYRALGDAVQGDDAIASLTDLFITLGVDPAGFEFTASTSKLTGSSEYSWAKANKIVNGAVVNESWSTSFAATFTGGGLASLAGTLAPMVDLGEYSVISPAEAVDRLNDTRFAGRQQWNDETSVKMDGPDGAMQDAVGKKDVPPTPEAGAEVAWQLQSVTITKAELTTVEHYLPNGAVVLMPMYSLSDKAGATWTVPALAESHLRFAG